MAKILIVEDEGLVAADTRMSLEDLGHEVVGIAGSGSDALRIIEEDRPALVLMDIVLQGDLSGIQTAKAINERYGIPIIYMTAHSDADTLANINETNHHGVLIKPFVDAQLRDMIEEVLSET